MESEEDVWDKCGKIHGLKCTIVINLKMVVQVLHVFYAILFTLLLFHFLSGLECCIIRYRVKKALICHNNMDSSSVESFFSLQPNTCWSLKWLTNRGLCKSCFWKQGEGFEARSTVSCWTGRTNTYRQNDQKQSVYNCETGIYARN